MRDSRRVHWLGQSWSAVTGQAGRQHSGGQMMSKQSATGGMGAQRVWEMLGHRQTLVGGCE